jgi:hypothetical protein
MADALKNAISASLSLEASSTGIGLIIAGEVYNGIEGAGTKGIPLKKMGNLSSSAIPLE